MRVHLFLTAGLVLGLVAVVWAVALDRPAEAQGHCDRYVLAVQGSDAGDCSVAGSPCRTVQYAIDHATDGDRICVARRSADPGPTVYQETIYIRRTLVLDGKWEASCSLLPFGCAFKPVACRPRNVVLDAKATGRTVTIEGKVAPTIDCFTITGGDAAGWGGDPDGNDAGGGIYARDAAPIIVSSVISGNYGCDLCPSNYGRGGGIYMLNAPATAVISGNLIAHNVADDSTWGQGGGLMLRDSDTQVRGNIVEFNRAGLSAGDGGGIAVRHGTPVIADNAVLYNVAGQSVQGLGGGIFVWSSTPATIERNLVAFNQALSGPGDPILISRGGGICYMGSPTTTAVIVDNTIRSNLAAPQGPLAHGGGIYVEDLAAPSLIQGNLLDGNIAGHNDDGRGGGIYAATSEVTIAGNRLVSNSATWAGSFGQGGGLFVESSQVLVEDNELVSNAGGGFPGFPSVAEGWGGGLVISASVATVQDNWIEGNSGTNGEGLGAGGGIWSFRSDLIAARNVISDNLATAHDWGFGGGAYLEESTPTLDANLILNNVAANGPQGRGGGVRLSFCSSLTLTNNILAGNRASELGSGLSLAGGSAGTAAHNTIAANLDGDESGVRVESSSHLLLYNTIVVSQVVGILNAAPASSSAEAHVTLFEGNTTNYGAGVASDVEIGGPARLAPDYHLTLGSTAIDAGLTLAWVAWDIDGEVRPLGTASDVGADELPVARVYLPLVQRATP